jgi:hypothetical protein
MSVDQAAEDTVSPRTNPAILSNQEDSTSATMDTTWTPGETWTDPSHASSSSAGLTLPSTSATPGFSFSSFPSSRPSEDNPIEPVVEEILQLQQAVALSEGVVRSSAAFIASSQVWIDHFENNISRAQGIITGLSGEMYWQQAREATPEQRIEMAKSYVVPEM